MRYFNWVSTLLFVLPIFKICSAQELRFSINSYNHSLALSLSDNGNSSFVYQDYGTVQISNTSGLTYPKYLFHSQEYDAILNLYHFKSRVFSPENSFFLQPDPLSQYHSPYTFLQGDPINYIDWDGNEGRPLVLYNLDHNEPGSIGPTTEDFIIATPDAYHVPMTRFVNGKVGDLPEWNGNVFIKGHMTQDPGREIAVEFGHRSKPFKATNPKVKHIIQDEEIWRTIDGREMGSMLKKFSIERGVPLRNVVAGGCQGSAAAKAIRNGFEDTPTTSDMGKARIRFSGLKKGRDAAYMGQNVAKSENTSFEGGTRFYAIPSDDTSQDYIIRERNGNNHLEGFGRFNTETNSFEELPRAQGAQLQEMANGRLPSNMLDDFMIFRGFY